MRFCVLAYVDGRPVSAERFAASSAAEAVRRVLLDGRLVSCEVFEGKRKVAVEPMVLTERPAIQKDPIARFDPKLRREQT